MMMRLERRLRRRGRGGLRGVWWEEHDVEEEKEHDFEEKDFDE